MDAKEPNLPENSASEFEFSSINGRVHFRAHEHRLIFLERLPTDCSLECCICEEESDKLMFWCPLCSFSLHLLCGPLPITLPYHYAGYDLNLSLTDTLLDGVDPEDSWCDICEEARRPEECVYRSPDPPFTAATDCVMPQILKALQGDLGQMQLRTVEGHIPGMVLPVTAQELAEEESLLVDDGEEVIQETEIEAPTAEVVNSGVCGAFTMKQLEDSLTKEDDEHLEQFSTEYSKIGNCGDAIPFKFSDEAFELFKEHVAISGGVHYLFVIPWLIEERDELVKVGDNFVVSESASLYRQMLDKHGDFTANSQLGQNGRALCLSKFVNMIHGMQGRQVFETTGDVLCSWQWFLEKFRDEFGFDVQFALDNLEKVARARYALELTLVRDEIAADLAKQIERLVREIEEDKPEIEALRGQYIRAKTGSALAKQCSAIKPSKLQWKNAGEFLGLQEPEE